MLMWTDWVVEVLGGWVQSCFPTLHLKVEFHRVFSTSPPSPSPHVQPPPLPHVSTPPPFPRGNCHVHLLPRLQPQGRQVVGRDLREDLLKRPSESPNRLVVFFPS